MTLTFFKRFEKSAEEASLFLKWVSNEAAMIVKRGVGKPRRCNRMHIKFTTFVLGTQ